MAAVHSLSSVEFKQNRMGFMFPTNFEQAQLVAKTMVDSGCIPDWHYSQKSPIASVMMCLQKGIEVGLTPTESLQKICRINGVLAIWGDAALGLCKVSPDYEYCRETYDPITLTATCEVKRKGEPTVIRIYSKEDAQKAGLWGKMHKKKNKEGKWYEVPSCWVTCDKRMLQLRARGFGLRDCFPHVLLGLYLVEEFAGTDEIEINPLEQKIITAVSENVVSDDVPQEKPLTSVDSVKQKLKAKFSVERPVEINNTPAEPQMIELQMEQKIKEETINHLKFLVAQCQIPQKTVGKWFTKANASNWSDFSERQAQQLIDMLESRYPESAQAWLDVASIRNEVGEQMVL